MTEKKCDESLALCVSHPSDEIVFHCGRYKDHEGPHRAIGTYGTSKQHWKFEWWED